MFWAESCQNMMSLTGCLTKKSDCFWTNLFRIVYFCSQDFEDFENRIVEFCLPDFEDFGNRTVDFCLQDFRRKNYGKDMAGNYHAMCLPWAQCGRAKRTLLSSTQTTIEIDSSSDGIDYSSPLPRARFEELITGDPRYLIGPVG